MINQEIKLLVEIHKEKAREIWSEQNEDEYQRRYFKVQEDLDQTVEEIIKRIKNSLKRKKVIKK